MKRKCGSDKIINRNDSTDKDTEGEKAMKKQIAILFLVLFTAIALICVSAAAYEDELTSFGEFSGNGTINAELAGFSGTPFIFFEKPLYARSTLPD